MADESLITLAQEVRAKTLRLMDGVSDAEARFAAPGLQNSILWHAGHALMSVQYLCIGLVDREQPAFWERWYNIFSWDSKPATVTDWPAVGDVVGELTAQLPRLLRTIRSLDDEQLQHAPSEKTTKPLRYYIVHGLHDEANHQGEIWLLKKMWAKRSAQK